MTLKNTNLFIAKCTNDVHITDKEKNTEFQIWLHILKHAPVDSWKVPVATFINNTKEELPNDKIKLSNENIKRCNYFMRNIARYIYAKSLADEPKDGLSIKQEMLRATKIAGQGKIYEPNINITKNFRLSKQFEQKLNGNIPKQLQWGLCAVVEFSHNLNDFIKKSKKHVLETAVVEQLFPNKWSPDFPDDVNKWNDKRIKKSLQTIGNLVLIEQEIHRNTNKIYTNNFFAKRKNPNTGKGYKDSVFNELIMMCQISDNVEWFYGLWKTRQKYSVERLVEFFSALYYPTLH
ncbi:MAG: hypothetical protein LBP87_06700 [Planctomycetaceae bacterium]|jgi:hypothetical protein|nr:hypothetical protein [Planctomycetaceae bacterium]